MNKIKCPNCKSHKITIMKDPNFIIIQCKKCGFMINKKVKIYGNNFIIIRE